jgi:hypothetical protein
MVPGPEPPHLAYINCVASYASFTGRWHAHGMIKGCFNAAVAAAIASLLDKHFYDGRHVDAALVILRQIRHSFGL